MKYINMLLLSFIALGLYAQQSGETQKYSLQEAITYALKYNQTLKNAQLDMQVAQNKIKETRAIGLPQVSAEGKLVYTPQIPKIGIPDPFGGSGILEFPQGIDYAVTSNITASQLLFDGGFLMGLQAAKEYEALSKLNIQRSEQETELSVVKAYCMALVAEESIKLIDVSINTLQETEKTLKASYQAGLVEKTEADRISITYSNLVIQRKKTVDMRDIAYYNLKIQMGLNAKQAIELTDDLSRLNELLLKSDTEIPATVDYSKRAEYKILDQQIRLHTLDKKRYQYGYVPSLAAFIQHQENAFNTSFSPLFNKFYPGTLMGLTLTVPIFDGLSKRSKVQQARLNIEMAENTKTQMESLIEMEVFSSKTNYLRAKELLDQQVKNKELAEEVYKRVNTKYQNGLSSSLDVITADKDLKEAQQNYLQSIYDLIVAKAELKKALGNN